MTVGDVPAWVSEANEAPDHRGGWDTGYQGVLHAFPNQIITCSEAPQGEQCTGQ